MKLCEIVHPRSAASRSVNLERDQDDAGVVADYVVTAKARDVLSRFADALGGSATSAWSLTGPYGMGKSAFSNFLLALTGPSPSPTAKAAWRSLRNADRALAQRLRRRMRQRKGQGFLQVRVTSAYEPVNQSLCRGLLHGLRHYGKSIQRRKSGRVLIAELEELGQQQLVDTNRLCRAFAEAASAVAAPIVLVVDEFGKNLEYLAHHPDEGDIFALQLLAETDQVYTWVCLHLAFQEYAVGLDAQQRREWSKVQGRFEDISFVESTAQMLSLMQHAIGWTGGGRAATRIGSFTKRLAEEARRVGLALDGLASAAALKSLYPLHPLSALLLPELCRRFAQNDRTLFAFLCGGDDRALPRFLELHELPSRGRVLPLLGLERLYDFFFGAASTVFLDRAESQRWFEIHRIIESAQSLSDVQQAILKTVGVLNLVAGAGVPKASADILALALRGVAGELDGQLGELTDRGVLFYREYADEYRLWEGSDFDIFGAVRETKAKLALRPLADVLSSTITLPPLIASRHSYETGTVRYIERRYASLSCLDDSPACSEPTYDGLLLYIFGTQREVADVPELTAGGKPLIVAYAPCERQIKELVLEAAAAQTTLREAPELAHDGVARKEARFRAEAAEQRLIDYLGQLFAPESTEVRWFADGEPKCVSAQRHISALASELCDTAYAACPPINNEMINYNSLSSSAARARRELAEAMVEREGMETLGFEGTGPEVAVYRALFKANGLHRRDRDGLWRCVRPPKGSPFIPLWDKLNESVREDDGDGIRVADLIEELRRPPFCLREGPIPLFICWFVLVQSDELAVFQEGAYLPFITGADIALLVKRPDLFTLKRFAPVGVRRKVFQTYLAILDTDGFRAEASVRNATLLSVVGPLVRFVEGLPEYSTYTRSVSPNAIKVRSAILNSREPLDLLYRDLPQAVGIDPCEKGGPSRDWQKELQNRLRRSLLELARAYDCLVDQVQVIVLNAFDAPGGLAAFRGDIVARVGPLVTACGDAWLARVLRALLERDAEDRGWLCRIAGQVMQKRVEVWRDSDIEPFRATIADLADRIDSLAYLVASANEGLAGEAPSASLLTVLSADGSQRRRILRPSRRHSREVSKLLKSLAELSERDLAFLLLAVSDQLLGEP